MTLSQEQQILYDKWRSTFNDDDLLALYKSFEAKPLGTTPAAISKCPAPGGEISGGAGILAVTRQGRSRSPLSFLLGESGSGAAIPAWPRDTSRRAERDKILRVFDWNKATDLSYLDWFFGPQGPAVGVQFPLEIDS